MPRLDVRDVVRARPTRVLTSRQIKDRRHRRERVESDREPVRQPGLVPGQIGEIGLVLPQALPPIRTQPAQIVRVVETETTAPSRRPKRPARVTAVRGQLPGRVEARLTRRIRKEMPRLDVGDVVRARRTRILRRIKVEHRHVRRHRVVSDRKRRRGRALVPCQVDSPGRVRPHTLPPVSPQPTSRIRERRKRPHEPPLRDARVVRTTRQLPTIRRQLMQVPKRRLTRRVRHVMPVIHVRDVVRARRTRILRRIQVQHRHIRRSGVDRVQQLR